MLDIKDGLGSAKKIQSTEDTGEHIVHHYDKQGLDTSGYGHITTTYSDDGVVSGIAHTIGVATTISDASSLNFLLDMSAVTNKDIFILPIEVESDSETILVKVYEDSDYSGGTPVETRNASREHSDTTQFIVTTGATGSDKGTELKPLTRYVFAGFFKTGHGKGYSFIILDTSKKYLVELSVVGTGSSLINVHSLLFESPSYS